MQEMSPAWHRRSGLSEQETQQKSTMWCDCGGIPQAMQKHLKALKKSAHCA